MNGPAVSLGAHTPGCRLDLAERHTAQGPSEKVQA